MYITVDATVQKIELSQYELNKLLNVTIFAITVNSRGLNNKNKKYWGNYSMSQAERCPGITLRSSHWDDIFSDCRLLFKVKLLLNKIFR